MFVCFFLKQKWKVRNKFLYRALKNNFFEIKYEKKHLLKKNAMLFLHIHVGSLILFQTCLTNAQK